MHKTYKLLIIGKVQGVWYRASAKDKALALGLTGKIWNEKDGSVSAIIQGDEELINEFIEWCKEGPPLSKVDKVYSEEYPDSENFKSFEIVRSS